MLSQIIPVGHILPGLRISVLFLSILGITDRHRLIFPIIDTKEKMIILQIFILIKYKNSFIVCILYYCLFSLATFIINHDFLNLHN